LVFNDWAICLYSLYITMNKKLANLTDLIIDIITSWSKKFKLSPLYIVFDNKESYFIAYVWKYKGRRYISVNVRTMLKLKYTPSQVMRVIFHELGHLKHNAFGDKEGKVKAEFIAETQMLVWMKKYLPNSYKEVVYNQKRQLKKGVYKGYYKKAFSQIPEYQS